MRDIYLQSKLEMAKTLHIYGVELAHISVATGLSQSRLVTDLKIADDVEFGKHKAKKY
ncbi:MAG: glycine cleavage system protein T [Leclercia adecarboxylata]|uniref:Glycine cleavage system protein T n=1 Tax=Leclercia adecarboxylata TaxID=83655 RepID=A0AAP9DC38_9ENTR|nr:MULTISPECIES: glycine cleavage system protein T [Leclercia]MDK4745565.1 glycine cleavage system protein T [Leclercia adecarboxylata]MDU1062104.1 glycine cleavage system protein T [Leclercia adecarboxylata]MDU4840074.1 glycine cleavage system protein T [Leclercia adecarboxylata]QDK19878.1 glycine cleavage system protein T [Leclercia adecarboxylata]QGU14503.1 glycine cleavage system protein T [Leclercia sp. 119287]